MSLGRTLTRRRAPLDYRISPDERARFKRCRRQWDFASLHRRDLEPTESLDTSALPAAVKDALAVYYYPGTWDWQHEFKPQHVRVNVRELRPAQDGRIDQRTAGVLRRTRIRRSRDEIAAVGRLIAAEALDMTGAPAPYPNPGPHCLVCEFTEPCLAMFAGADPEPLLATRFRRHTDEDRSKPRLGQVTWGFGRGAAPPGW